jgi:hypothetical protein
MSFASRLFFGALSTCLRLRPRSTNEGLVIWCGLIVSLAFVYVYPAIEMVEEWRLRRSAEKDLAQMRMHAKPPTTDGTSLAVNGWLEGSSSHLSSPWRMPTLAASTR